MPVILKSIERKIPREFNLRPGGPNQDLTLSGTVEVQLGKADPVGAKVKVDLALTVISQNGCIVFDEGGRPMTRVERSIDLEEGVHPLEGPFSLKMAKGAKLADSSNFTIEIVVNGDDNESGAWKFTNRL